jgi:pyrophosphatase PpaX
MNKEEGAMAADPHNRNLVLNGIEGVLFDLDGTLNDSEWLAQEAYSVGISHAIGADLTEEQKKLLMGRPFSDLFSVLPRLSQSEYDAIVAETLAYYKKRNHEVKSYPGIKELLRKLNRAGFRLGIVTAKLRENALFELDSNSILEYFEQVFAKEDCREFKPSPRPLLDLAERMGIAPSRCLYLGDQPSDVVAANSAGMVSCAALWGEGERKRLEPVNPGFFFDTVEDFSRELGSVKK